MVASVVVAGLAALCLGAAIGPLLLGRHFVPVPARGATGIVAKFPNEHCVSTGALEEISSDVE